MRQFLFATVALCLVLLGACGQTGPLYQPEEPEQSNETSGPSHL